MQCDVKMFSYLEMLSVHIRYYIYPTVKAISYNHSWVQMNTWGFLHHYKLMFITHKGLIVSQEYPSSETN